MPYTRVQIWAEPGNYLSDLTFKEKKPLWVAWVEPLERFRWAIALLIFIICSCLSSLLAGSFALKEYRFPRNKLALMGFFNALTLIGFYFVSREYIQRVDNSVDYDTYPGWDKVHRLFISLFSISFVGMMAGFALFFTSWH